MGSKWNPSVDIVTGKQTVVVTMVTADIVNCHVIFLYIQS